MAQGYGPRQGIGAYYRNGRFCGKIRPSYRYISYPNEEGSL